jgi:glutamate/tyrosine decarboxylase-like PLP-dependent enzyme
VTDADLLQLDASTRRDLWRAVGAAIEDYHRDVVHLGARAEMDAAEIRAAVEAFDFDHPLRPEAALSLAVDAMRRLDSHVSHPRHFGLFNPAPTAMGVAAQALIAAFNPCLASRAGSPFGVEVERHLVRTFGQLFGFEPASADGITTTGGSESNLTGVLLALAARIPGYQESGLRAAGGPPVIYVTRHAHPSTLKAAAVTGLGTAAVREVPADRWYRLDPAALDQMIRADLAAGRVPLTVVATAGTTDAGVIDPIAEVAGVAARHGLWVHVDAAWGGAAMLVPEIRDAFHGIDQADSVAFDPHKWLSVPMGCGLLLTRHRGLLDRAFGVAVPFLAGLEEPGVDPHTRSIRWSRDFSGLKLLLSLAVAGWQGYEVALRRQVLLAERLREALVCDGWKIVNDTPLPVVCFASEFDGKHDLVAEAVNSSGEALVFPVRLGDQVVLRACVTNYATSEDDVDQLVSLLGQARAEVQSGALDDQVCAWNGGGASTCSATINFSPEGMCAP